MSDYRKIHYPKCPYCGYVYEYNNLRDISTCDYSNLVNMATGCGSSDVIMRCKQCNKEYRVTCSIKYNTRKIKDGEEE